MSPLDRPVFSQSTRDMLFVECFDKNSVVSNSPYQIVCQLVARLEEALCLNKNVLRKYSRLKTEIFTKAAVLGLLAHHSQLWTDFLHPKLVAYSLRGKDLIYAT